MVYYGIASRAIQEVIAFYRTRDEAEGVLQVLREDAPELDDDAFLVEVELPTPSRN